MAKVMVLGGAGYVGSHTACAFKASGHDVIIVDDLSSGKTENIRWGPIYELELNDLPELTAAFAAQKPDLVVHCAGVPHLAWRGDHAALHRVHIGATLMLMEAMIGAHVRHVVFASSCEIFGPPTDLPISERHPQAPGDPYSWSMQVSEQVLRDLAATSGITFSILRAFNIAGASEACPYGGDHPAPFNPLPPMLDALVGDTPAYDLFGTDHPTRDGTLERELVHVSDVADAHVLAGERLLGGGSSLTCNLGRGRGVTLNEMLVMIRRVTGARLQVNEHPRLFEDAPRLFAAGKLAREELGWKPKIGVEATIRSAVEARRAPAHQSGGAA